jgi:cytochrome c
MNILTFVQYAKKSTMCLAFFLATSGAALATPDLIRKYNCVACHAEAAKKVGPSYKDVAAKYAGKADAVDYLTKKIRAGGSGVWGAMPMPPHPQVSDADSGVMATYILNVK